MADAKDPNVWELIFNQTPTVLRWVLGVMTFGLFSLASVLYRWHRSDMREMHNRIDRLESTIDQRQQETNRLLLEIAQNTGSRS